MQRGGTAERPKARMVFCSVGDPLKPGQSEAILVTEVILKLATGPHSWAVVTGARRSLPGLCHLG